MITVKIEFIINEAFIGGEQREATQILHNLAKRFEYGNIRADKQDYLPIFDYENNKIGEVEVIKE